MPNSFIEIDSPKCGMARSQIENTLAALGDCGRSVYKECVIDHTNPYVPPPDFGSPSVRSQSRSVYATVIAGWCLLLTGVATMVVLPERTISPFIDAVGSFGFFVLIASPAIYWETVCRLSKRASSLTEALASSFLRCWIVYGSGALLVFFMLSAVTHTGPFQDDRSRSETRDISVMLFSTGIVAGAILLASYDFWRYKQRKTEP